MIEGGLIRIPKAELNRYERLALRIQLAHVLDETDHVGNTTRTVAQRRLRRIRDIARGMLAQLDRVENDPPEQE